MDSSIALYFYRYLKTLDYQSQSSKVVLNRSFPSRIQPEPGQKPNIGLHNSRVGAIPLYMADYGARTIDEFVGYLSAIRHCPSVITLP